MRNYGAHYALVYMASILLVVVPVICWSNENDNENKDIIGNKLSGNRDKRVAEANEMAQKAIKRIQSLKINSEIPNWALIHTLLVFRSGHDGDLITKRNMLIELLCGSDTSAFNDNAFTTRRGLPWPKHVREKYMEEDHFDQYLFCLLDNQIGLDTRIFIKGKQFVLKDLLNNSLKEVTALRELSWTVSAYSYCLEPNVKWENKFGDELTMGKLLKALLEEDLQVCYGTHTLGAYARIITQSKWKKDNEVKKLIPTINKKIEKAKLILKDNQAKEGFFLLPGKRIPDSDVLKNPFARCVHYTGHNMEWLAIALTKDELTEEWILKAVVFLSDAIANQFIVGDTVFLPTSEKIYNYGSICHAISALQLWSARIDRK